MIRSIDINAILTPIPGKNPSGEDLRYSPIFDEITEARRADDLLNRGDWNRELKVSDWDKVITLSTKILSAQTKDLRIAVWLTEALLKTEGFEGFSIGLKILTGLLDNFWESIYPEIENGDLEFRIGPLEFLNDKLSLFIKELPITDPAASPGYSWIKWQESRQVGSEEDILNQWGDVDEGKKKARDEKIADGKITVEEFQSAIKKSSRVYYEQLTGLLSSCLEEFQRLDSLVDHKFGKDAPRLSSIKSSLDDCFQQVNRILKDKKSEEPQQPSDNAVQGHPTLTETGEAANREQPCEGFAETIPPQLAVAANNMPRALSVNRLLGSGGNEESLWVQALTTMKISGVEKAVELLLGAACSSQSIREKTTYRLLMAKLCLQANRSDLARPIAEELNLLLDELQLTRWESPIWIAEVYDVLYRCIIAEGSSDDDKYKAAELLKKICTTDVTKAMKYK